MEIGAGPPIVDALTNLTIKAGQPDGTTPILHHRVGIPAGFRFAVGSIDRARHPNGAPVLTCGEVSRLDAPARMEAVGYFVVGVQTDNTRDPNPHVHTQVTPSTGGPVDGRSNAATEATSDPGPAYFGSPPNGNGVIYFREWIPQENKAVLCGYAFAAAARIPVAHRNLAIQLDLVLQTDNSWVLSFNFDRVSGDDPINPASITDKSYFIDNHVSVIDTMITFQGLSGGNFQSDPAGGPCKQKVGDPPRGFCPVAFLRNPTIQGSYTARMDVSQCRVTDPPCSAAPRHFETILSITRPPAAYLHKGATLIGPLTGRIPAGYAFINNGSIPFAWLPAQAHSAERVKGYVLALAEPGNTETLHFEYMVTDPGQPGFDPRQPCGADGKAEQCTLTLSFPLSTVGSDPLYGEGLYHAALITMYEDGHRTDGLCDDGPLNPFGKPCPSGDPPFRIQEPGVSMWQILARSGEWPLAFFNIQAVTRTGGGGTTIAPNRVLLVDFDRRRAEFIVWNPLGVKEDSFFAASNGIVGTNVTGGTVLFQSSTMTGHTINWRFDGFVAPAATIPCGPAVVRSCGTFVRYDLKGLPGALGTHGWPPTVSPELFAGTPLF